MSIPRAAFRLYHPFVVEYFPMKLIGAFITADRKVGCLEACRFCLNRRHDTRREMLDLGLMIDNRFPIPKMAGLIRRLPSYEAGVQIRMGHDTDGAFEFGMARELVLRLDDDHSITHLTRLPLSSEARSFFGEYRKNVLLKLTATPRSALLNVRANPLVLVQTAQAIDPRMAYWVIGPLAADSLPDAYATIDALPAGSQLYLKELNREGIPGMEGVPLLTDSQYSDLEAFALRRGLEVTEYFCSRGLGRLGQTFFDIDKITGDKNSARRERQLSYCAPCPSHEACFEEVERPRFEEGVRAQLEYLGLTLMPKVSGAPTPIEWLGPKTLNVYVNEPSSRGDETFLNHVLRPRVSINLLSAQPSRSGVPGIAAAMRSHGGSFSFVSPEVLSRWWLNDFFPVNDMNNFGEAVMRGVEGKLGYKFWDAFPVEKPSATLPCRNPR